MPSPTHLILRAAVCLSALCLSAGCTSSDARAQQAITDYQSAAAANNLPEARRALLELVRAKDDVADYWIQLGKLEANMGSFGDAYYAFSRAYELDRSDAAVLRAVTELGLRTGDIALAQTRAHELEVVAPGDPWVKLADGWVAIGQSHFDKALAAADALLATDPFSSSATILKGRALLGLDREDEAVDLLNKQVLAQPSDVGSLEFLGRIYLSRGDWAKTAEVARRIGVQAPANRANLLLLVEAAFRSGNVGLGRAASARLLQPNAEPAIVAAVLDRWEDHWPSPQRIQDARALGRRATGLEQRLVYAGFLTRVGSPADAVRLSAEAADLPVTAKTAEANAILANAWLAMGRVGDAKARLDAVIAFDPGNATALRGRSQLELKTGNVAAAITDAQKLVTVLPSSSRDRLLLARCYAVSGNRAWVERTLWAAFQDIPGDEKIFAALLATKKGNSEAAGDLQREFERQREAKVGGGLL